MVLRLFGVGLALGLMACGFGPPTYDPAFASTAVAESSGSCAEPDFCVEVRAPVIGNRRGVGSCALYGPGDPDTPLAESGDLEMRPGDVVTWATPIRGVAQVDELSADCQPMAEG